MDVRKETTDASGMHQRHKESRPKRSVMFRMFDEALKQALGLEMAKLIFGSSVRILEMGVKTLRSSRPLPKRRKRLVTT